MQSPALDVEFAEPVLCAVCQGLIGYLHPHPSQQLQPLAEPLAGQEAPARHEAAHAWATGVVSGLLTERFVGEGRPRPAWAEGWTWPPRPGPA